MSMGKQTSVRQNTAPTGGVANPSGVQNSPLQVKMPKLQEMQYCEMFRSATEFNTVSQAPVNMSIGQESSFKVNNIGFLETINLEVNATITLKNNNATTRTIAVAEDFPMNIISRVNSQFNGNTTTHSTTPYNLFMLSMKRAMGMKGLNPCSLATQTSATSALTFANANLQLNQKFPIDVMSVTLSDDIAGTAYTVENSANHNKTLTGLLSIAIPQNKTVTITVKFFIPIHYTIRKDLPIGLIPLQNNSVYLELKAVVSNIISTTYATPFVSVDSTELADITVGSTITATPHNDFYTVPDPAMGGQELYSYFLGYNYIINDQTQVINATGVDALAYNMPNNSYLASVLLTAKNSTTKRLQDVTTLFGNIYVDYNGTAVVRKNPISFDLFKNAMNYVGGNPANFGQFIKDFWTPELNANGADWSQMINLYDANSPVLKGQVNSSGVEITVTRENVVPVNVITI